MLGSVKSWLRKWVEEPPAVPLPPAKPMFHSRSPALPVSAQPALPAAVEPAHTNGSYGTKADVLELPLATVFNVLPKDLQARARLPLDGQAAVSVPFGVVFPQLGRGAVKITFGDLRQMSPAETFYSQTDRDQAVVELPLGEILARLQPAMLPRRAQKSVDVPSEITSPFADKGEGLQIYKPQTAPVKSFSRPQPEPEFDPFSAAPEFPVRGHIKSVPPSPQPFSPPLPATAPIAMPSASRNHPAPPPSTSSLVQAAAYPEKGDGAVLLVALAELAETWPPAVRSEVTMMKLTSAIVALPLTLVEDALKKGRATFTWKQIRSWTNSIAATATSQHNDEMVELPLKVIAPLFLAQQRTAKSAQKTAVDNSIPELFARSSKPAPTVPATNGSGSSDTAQFRAPKPAPISIDTQFSAKAPANDDVRSGTEFLKRYATPNDIVAKAASLDGVLGALITLPDGLLVASHLPANMNGDALAAFTPQIYVRVTQSAREYRMGDLKDLTFTVGSTQWKIYKVGSIFFAAFGKSDEQLPVKELITLAAELDRKPKSQV